MLKIPISMDGASFTASEIEEQRQDGTRATELSLIGALNMALDFSGASDHYVNILDHADFDATTALTIVCWVKVNSNSSDFTITKRIQGGDDAYTMSFTNAGRCLGSIFISGAEKLTTGETTILTPGTWYLLALVYNGTTLKSYLNGVEEGTLTVSGNIDTTSDPIRIGWGYSNTYNLDGSIDEVGIWKNRALKVTDLLDLYNSGTGLVIDPATSFPTSGDSMGTSLSGLWHLNESSGTNAHDSSGNGHDGTLTNMVGDEWVPGKITTFNTTSIITLADIDSGVSGSIWDMSTIEIFENPNSEAGSLKYKYAYGNSANPSNWNGSWLTKTNLRLESDVSGKYFKLQTQFTSDASQDVTISDGWIEVDVPSGGEQSHAYIE